MSWFYRKSIGSGPFRINFSPRGISSSIGLKGARVNMSRKGTYVNLNFHGISYRQRISGPATPVHQTQSTEVINNISSANIDQLTDTDSKAFITELNQKCRKFSYAKLLGIFPLCVIILILISISNNPYLQYELVACFSCFIPLILWLKKVDRKRFEMELHYDMDDKYQQVYQQFSAYFETFSRSSKIWQYLNTRHTSDHKRNAGAGKLVNRTRIRNVSMNKMPIPHFITNVAIPCISLRNMELFFLPERLLVKRENTFAAIFYKNLDITRHIVRFVESDILPKDAEVVDHTWLYVNRNGGPDKRFNNNRRLPICAYSEYTFMSDTGFFEIIMTSKMEAMDDFVEFLLKIGELQSRVKF